jgi:HK97 gp10 family phage protein
MIARVIVQKNASKQASRVFDAELRRIITSATFAVEGRAKTLAPVDTGNLKNSIQGDVSANGKTGTVTAHAEYAAYVEMGTSRTPAQPYLLPALRAVLPKLRASLRNIGAVVR